MVLPRHWMNQIYHGTADDCGRLSIGWHRMHMDLLDGHPEHFKGTAGTPSIASGRRHCLQLTALFWNCNAATVFLEGQTTSLCAVVFINVNL